MSAEPTTEYMKVIFARLADGQWHRHDRVVNEAAPKVEHFYALRRFERMQGADEQRRTTSRRRPSQSYQTEAMKIAAGQHRTVVHGMSRSPRIEMRVSDGAKEVRLRPHAGTSARDAAGRFRAADQGG